MKKKIYKVVVIGLGKAGSLYDINKDKFFSHSNSININKRLELVAGVDSNKKKAIAFQKKYNLKAYLTINELIKKEKFDLIVISVPTNKQFEVLKYLLKFIKNKTVLCEKPCTKNLKEITTIQTLCKIRKVKLYINFQRNSLKSSQLIKRIIKNEKQAFINVTYSQGVLNSASHYISLFLSFFSNRYSNLTKLKGYKSNIKNDFLSNFQINFEKININFVSKPKFKKIYGAFELKGKKTNIKYLFGGRKIIIKNNISKKIKQIKSDIHNSQLLVYNQLINSLDGKKTSLCSIDNGIETFKIINKIK